MIYQILTILVSIIISSKALAQITFQRANIKLSDYPGGDFNSDLKSDFNGMDDSLPKPNRYLSFSYTLDLVSCSRPCQTRYPIDIIPLLEQPFESMNVGLRQKDTQEFERAREIPVWFDDGGVGLMNQKLIIGVVPANSKELHPQARHKISVHSLIGDLKNFLGPNSKVDIQPLTPSFPDQTILIATTESPEAAIQVMNALTRHPHVAYIHPDFRLPIEVRATNPPKTPLTLENPTDPFYTQSWHLAKIHAEKAWTITHGSQNTVIALIDLGFQQSHPDLQEAWFINPKEISGNGLDDDNNGLIDDSAGWNFAIDRPNLIYGSAPNHGTATAGIIGARSNSIGSLGICYECRILPIVIDDHVSSAIKAMAYAFEQGAIVVSNSWGYALETPIMDGLIHAIQKLHTSGRSGLGVSIVFAMSNYERNDCIGRRPDISSLGDIVAVSSADRNDYKVVKSGSGPCLKLLAPSSQSQNQGIVTTDMLGKAGMNNGREATDLNDMNYTNRFYGTSAAAPQVAAALGLGYSLRPFAQAKIMESSLFNSAQKVHPKEAAYDSNSGHSDTYGYGLLDIGTFVQEAGKRLPSINN